MSIDKSINIPPPTFLTKKPKYSSTYLPFNNPAVNNMGKTMQNDINFCRKIKRKYVRNEAERACAKEAAASRMALEALKKELATSQVSSFVIEESCTETTVENFIPHNEEAYIDNLGTVPVQVVNYDLNTPISSNQIINQNNIVPYAVPATLPKNEETPTDKIKQMIGDNISNNVEIMFKTSDGSFVNVTDEMLQNITKGSLQYQVIDENGQASELQELQVENEMAVPNDDSTKFVDDVHSFLNAENMRPLGNQGLENNRNIANSLFVSQEVNKENDSTFNNVCSPNRGNTNEICSMNVYDDYKQSDYDESPNFLLTDHADSCPIFVPSGLNCKDPLTEACDIAENLSRADGEQDGLFAGINFEEMNDTIMSATEKNETNLTLEQCKYLLRDNVPMERSFVEYSPRKLRSARHLNNEMELDNDIDLDKRRYSLYGK